MAAEAELARIDEKNADDLAQVRAFQSRDDVQAVETERDALESQIRLLDVEWRTLAQDAGLIAAP